MKRVTGIGGIFFKSPDPQALTAWYRVHLGLEVQAWGGAELPGSNSPTLWTPFKADTSYFAPSEAPFMVNFRVADLQGLLAALRAEGCQVVGEPQDSEYGKFGWVLDLDGNKVELWEPPAAG
ncbi:MAG: VOC family protein [Burkholderiales bacterium]|uniref:VOC family protein n=1 Tax=Roseateles sp. TaxID=1971397 RepID=UPI000FB24FAF|nr:MAG: VOC family protein [Burkholderiales bacterium]